VTEMEDICDRNGGHFVLQVDSRGKHVSHRIAWWCSLKLNQRKESVDGFISVLGLISHLSNRQMGDVS